MLIRSQLKSNLSIICEEEKENENSVYIEDKNAEAFDEISIKAIDENESDSEQWEPFIDNQDQVIPEPKKH